ncbi:MULTISPECIES: lycopene cyclase domain-containing protein [unclassified Microbacterium]|uniref:lycopene cyclase domain-containing protein n=1 Tax=unclassified Microbacterium TaxID=2609290 RepID=UPI000CFC961B|nr:MULTISPECIES: lycopene cyclase domain-containing protein [unclassified Microbacterium]PQZ56051.1 lycopene e-cyclase isoprenoid transferase B [Microbacterium sp. MYb43]PQZ78496.1 lycopene e-cyclase isoprenoid transferase B [Microbacterium sp. MYb40]PRB22605.1 lycopene e-cyclase isoprenoid transferase B [Microbacterium sp. MYb54]PRB26825.1 lycopene e-cyclase isoprenoid transferase B [Microbacterium sp. MYb50]PRB68871.1 lycopene e-cyclase isoprenoid transferase B [Microbacterium sp. MYb24]
MTYIQLSACFLVVAVLGGVGLALASRRQGPRPGAVLLTALVLFLLTAAFDTVMIASGLFHYAQDPLLGLHIGLAPIEDFAYPLAGALLLPAVWTAMRARRARDRRSIDDEDLG